MPAISRTRFRIVIQQVERPFARDLDHEMEWLCKSLGLTEPIDKDKLALTIFKVIVQATEQDQALGSSEIARRVNMSRGAVINHLNKLERSGLIVRQGRYYIARSRSMSRTIKELQEEIDTIFNKMEETARAIDREFGLPLEE